jgi:prepilin-type N-terminal cleavage/methylation domain-containing protein
MTNKLFRNLILYLSLLLGISLVVYELIAFYYWHQLVSFPKLYFLLGVLWVLTLFSWYPKIKVGKLIIISIVIINIIAFFIISPATSIIVTILGVLGIIFSKIADAKKRFIGKLFIDLGLIMAGIAIIVMGISILKFKTVPEEVYILWVIAGVSFGFGIILTAITTPKQALMISLIATGLIGSLFIIYYICILSRSFFGEPVDQDALISFIISIIATIGIIGLELLLYRFRRSKFTWLWLFNILVIIPATWFGLGVVAIFIFIGIALFPHWRDVMNYLFPKWIRVRYREINPKSEIRNPKYELGFTLIELLIVIAIIAIVSVGLISSFGFAIWGIKHSELQTQAVYLAQSEMEYLRSIPYSELTDGTYTQLKSINPNPMPESTIQVKIEPEADGLKKIIVTIIWFEGNQKKKVALTTLLAQK